MTGLITAFLSGVLFAIGLGIAGMTRPDKVVAFLDVTGRWDPSLALVMVGAIGVHALVYWLTRSWRAPLFAPAFALPTRKDIDRRLVFGSAVFGVGWGLGGICPGPALTSLATGASSMVVFVVAMLVGMGLHSVVEVVRCRAGEEALQALSSRQDS